MTFKNYIAFLPPYLRRQRQDLKNAIVNATYYGNIKEAKAKADELNKWEQDYIKIVSQNQQASKSIN